MMCGLALEDRAWRPVKDRPGRTSAAQSCARVGILIMLRFCHLAWLRVIAISARRRYTLLPDCRRARIGAKPPASVRSMNHGDPSCVRFRLACGQTSTSPGLTASGTAWPTSRDRTVCWSCSSVTTARTSRRSSIGSSETAPNSAATAWVALPSALTTLPTIPEDSFDNMKRVAQDLRFPFPYLWDETQAGGSGLWRSMYTGFLRFRQGVEVAVSRPSGCLADRRRCPTLAGIYSRRWCNRANRLGS